MTPTKVNNSSITESKNNEVVEMLGKAFKSLLLKTTSDLKGGSNKQTNGVRKAVRDLELKFSNRYEKFSK